MNIVFLDSTSMYDSFMLKESVANMPNGRKSESSNGSHNYALKKTEDWCHFGAVSFCYLSLAQMGLGHIECS